MNIVVYTKDGSKRYSLYLEDGMFVKRLMGEHSLQFSNLKINRYINFKIGDYIVYKGEQYYINKEPNFRKINNFLFEYDLVFDGSRHNLSRYMFKHLGDFEFSFAGSVPTFASLVIGNVTEHEPTWTIQVEDGLEETYAIVDFSETNCLDAIANIAQAFGIEWDIQGKVIHFKKVIGNNTLLSFEYGKNKGLYRIAINRIEDMDVVTRLYVTGGTKNLPESYNGRLKLTSPIERNVDVYGIREEVYKNEEIFPERTSTATAVTKISNESWSISDSTLDFNLNDFWIGGEVPKIVFKSGDLNGNEFEIISYNNSTKTIRFKANQEENNYIIPSDNVRPEIGDKYTIVGIELPQTYVEDALERLEEKAIEFIEKYSTPTVEFDLTIDMIHYRDKGMNLRVGDVINFKYFEKGINAKVRVLDIQYSADFPNELRPNSVFTVRVGNDVTYTLFEKISKDLKENKKQVLNVMKQNAEIDRRSILSLNEFTSKVFDPDGNLEEAMIKSIAGLFGNDSMYFDLDPNPQITITENSLALTATNLIHHKYSIPTVGNTWVVPVFSINGLDEDKAYYLSVKASKTSLTDAEWVLSEESKSTEAEVGYWYFNLGVLSSVFEGQRDFRTTKMFTLISGGTIETDVITAYMINVKKLFAEIIEVGSNGFTNAGISGLTKETNPQTSVRFWSGTTAINRDNAPFNVLDDGSMNAFKGKIGSFNIDSYSLRSEDYESGSSTTGVSSGIILTNDGIIARNSNMSFLPATTGLDFSASLVGETSQPRPSTLPTWNSSIRAGVWGVRRQELTSQVLDLLENVWGVYGAVFTSTKFLSAIYQPVRIDNSSNAVTLTENDYYIAKGGSGAVNLPPLSAGVELGRTIVIKNGQGGGLTVNGNGASIYKVDNVVANSIVLDRGTTRTFRYGANQWLESDGG